MDRNTSWTSIGRPKRVALRKESVDRNSSSVATLAVLAIVALRKESVDRNFQRAINIQRPTVALRKESVDRNT